MSRKHNRKAEGFVREIRAARTLQCNRVVFQAPCVSECQSVSKDSDDDGRSIPGTLPFKRSIVGQMERADSASHANIKRLSLSFSCVGVHVEVIRNSVRFHS
jgi:hypothetical protein